MLKEDHGGWAGIRVPWIDSDNDNIRDEKEQAELNLYGEGTVISYGGDAGDGGTAVSGDAGGAGRSDGAGTRNWSVDGAGGGRWRPLGRRRWILWWFKRGCCFRN